MNFIVFRLIYQIGHNKLIIRTLYMLFQYQKQPVLFRTQTFSRYFPIKIQFRKINQGMPWTVCGHHV